MNQEPRYSVGEFERESRYIENLIWDALVIEEGQRVLFCGYPRDKRWIERAIEAGARVTVIEHREQIIRKFADAGAALLRGSTSVIPAKADSFDLAISFHYLHETDPFFHAQILSELARVAKRIAIVEPGPPADAVGKRIARLYSQAKRELGQFEYYQPLEYWRKLLQSVKAELSQHVFAFAKIPPREYLRDTIELLLDTMAVEEAPRSYLDELRELAKRSDTMILPPARFVLVGAAIGDLPQPIFTPREEPSPTPPLARAAQSATPVPEPPARQVSVAAGYEFPPDPPPKASKTSEAPAAPPVPPAGPGTVWTFSAGSEPAVASSPGPFGMPSMPAPPAPEQPAVPFGTPFAVPPAPGAAGETAAFGIPPIPNAPISGPPGVPSWQWEPPEGEKPPQPPGE